MSLDCEMFLSKYPMDNQTCTMILGSCKSLSPLLGSVWYIFSEHQGSDSLVFTAQMLIIAINNICGVNTRLFNPHSCSEHKTIQWTFAQWTQDYSIQICAVNTRLFNQHLCSEHNQHLNSGYKTVSFVSCVCIKLDPFVMGRDDRVVKTCNVSSMIANKYSAL